jgi:hypothetical protein
MRRDKPIYFGNICLRHLIGGVGQLVSQVPVVGQDQQTLAVDIEPADVEQSLISCQAPAAQGSSAAIGTRGNQVGDGTPALWIIHRDHDAARLVECEVEMPARRRNPRAIDSNHVALGVDPATQLDNDLRVHFDTALADHDLAGTARADAGLGEDLLEAYALIRLGH